MKRGLLLILVYPTSSGLTQSNHMHLRESSGTSEATYFFVPYPSLINLKSPNLRLTLPKEAYRIQIPYILTVQENFSNFALRRCMWFDEKTTNTFWLPQLTRHSFMFLSVLSIPQLRIIALLKNKTNQTCFSLIQVKDK